MCPDVFPSTALTIAWLTSPGLVWWLLQLFAAFGLVGPYPRRWKTWQNKRDARLSATRWAVAGCLGLSILPGAVGFVLGSWVDLTGRVCASDVAELRISYVPIEGMHPTGAPIILSGSLAQAGWAHLSRAVDYVPPSRRWTPPPRCWTWNGADISRRSSSGYSVEVREEGAQNYKPIRLFASGNHVHLPLIPSSKTLKFRRTYFAPEFVDWLATEIEKVSPGGFE